MLLHKEFAFASARFREGLPGITLILHLMFFGPFS